MKDLLMLLGLIVFSGALSAGVFVSPAEDELLGRHESGNLPFERMEIGDTLVYWHQRTIDGAIVEKDFIVLQFDKATQKLLARKGHWRDDLPEHFALTVSQSQAEALAGGKEATAKLYVISPESNTFPLHPPPRHPCWVVSSKEGRKTTVTIIDAVTGAVLGHGIPPPAASIPPGSSPPD